MNSLSMKPEFKPNLEQSKFTNEVCDFNSKDFHDLLGLYERVSGERIDINFQIGAKAVVVKNSSAEVIGGFMYGRENLEKDSVKKYLGYLKSRDDLYITGLCKDPESGKGLDMVSVLLGYIKDSEETFWGVVDNDNSKLIDKYRVNKVNLIAVPGTSHTLALF